MKNLRLIIIVCLSVVATSCKKETKDAVKPQKDSLNAKKDTVIQPEFHKELYGIYTGEFIGKEIVKDEQVDSEYITEISKRLSLKINRITKDSVYGQSIVNGNQRPFRGIFNKDSKSFVLDEPGDHKTDGRFEVKITNDSLTGKWMAFKKSAVKTPTKTLKLIKKEFVYNPNFMLNEEDDLIDWNDPQKFVEKYIDPQSGKTEKFTTYKNRIASDAVFTINASKQQLAENDLKTLRQLDLQIIKTSISARHGYSFKKETYRNFFEQTDWYIPVSDNVDNNLIPTEKENVILLNRFIKYAEDKYDYFGR